jgi:alkylated DNA repair protein (DNA oxidative demethylase)
LINQYKPAARMTLHQDKNEQDFSQPIVSVSLGVPAIFLFGGFERSDKPMKILLKHGDVVVWGGVSRHRFHGIQPVKSSYHPAFGDCRINLTFRQAG